MELKLALVLFNAGSVNSDYVADVFGLWTVLRFFGIEDAAHVLVARWWLIPSAVVGVVNDLNRADEFILVLGWVGQRRIYHQSVYVNLV